MDNVFSCPLLPFHCHNTITIIEIAYTGSMSQSLYYSNAYSKVVLPHLTPRQLNILYALLLLSGEQDTRVVTVNFDRLAPLTHVSHFNVRFVRQLGDKLTWCVLPNHQKTPFFTVFEIDEKRGVLTFALAPSVAHLVSVPASQFTSVNSDKYLHLRSRYAKEVYRHLRQFRRTGVWRVSLLQFRRLVSVPASYDLSALTHCVVNPVLRELSDMNLMVEKVYQPIPHVRGRGRLVAFEFHFTPELSLRQRKNKAKHDEHVRAEVIARLGQQATQYLWAHSQPAYGVLNGYSCALVRVVLCRLGCEDRWGEVIRAVEERAQTVGASVSPAQVTAWVETLVGADVCQVKAKPKVEKPVFHALSIAPRVKQKVELAANVVHSLWAVLSLWGVANDEREGWIMRVCEAVKRGVVANERRVLCEWLSRQVCTV